MPATVTVTIPATTANLGPGFDCLGLALGLYNEVTLAAAPAGTYPNDLHITIYGEGAGRLPGDARNLVAQAAARIFAHLGHGPAGLHITQHNRIPVGSGLGSSAAAVLGGMLAANALVDGGLSQAEILRLAAAMEGHPDNVVPAGLGGLVLINQAADGQLHVEPIPLPPQQVVIVLPDFDLPTATARAALPRQVPLADAIFNAGRLALLVRALAAGDYQRLPLAMQDRLHQPYRLPLIPGMAAAFAAAYAAGAAGVALSGAGPSLLAFAPDNHQAIAAAIQAAFAPAGLPSRAWILPVDAQGAQVGHAPT